MLDLIIVGAGPAGLTAGIYARQSGLSTLILGGRGAAGGLLNSTDKVNNFIGRPYVEGGELANSFVEHAAAEGVEIVHENVRTISTTDEGFELLTDANGYKARTVIYTAGSEPRKLGVAGEELEGVSYCATCDGLFFSDEDVAVVGGGDAAVEEALYLAGICKTVTMLVRSDFRAKAGLLQSLATVDNVRVLKGVSVERIVGEGTVEAVELSDGSSLSVEGVFIAVGQIPQSAPAEPHVELRPDGFIRASRERGFYVAGDVANPEYRQAIIAAGEGAKAALQVIAQLRF